MTKQKPEIDPEAHYKVRLGRVIKHGRTHLRPGQEITLKGKVVQEHLDAILEYNPA